jgi:hypothetical protein
MEYDKIIENYRNSKKNFSEIHENVIADMRFGLLGEQWDEQESAARKLENRKTDVFNQCRPMITNVVNNALKNAPAIKVHSLSNDNKETAQVYDGIIKHIENLSNSDSIYNEAFTNSVAGGMGAWKVIVEPITEEKYEIKLKHIVDPTSIYPDPSSTEFDFSDAKYIFQLIKMSKDEYEEKYPEKDCVSFDKSTSEDYVVVAEYWYKNSDGSVSYCVLNGEEILEKSENYPGKFLPFCIVIGDQIWVEGERHIKSIIADVKSIQKARNYMSCEALDYVSKHAKTPYIIASDSLDPDMQALWSKASSTNPYALPYVGGKEKPTRNDPPPAPIAYMESIASLDKDMKTIVGVRDPLEDIPATQSGKAIDLQISEGHINTAQWLDHLHRTIKYSGRVIVDLIPYVYNYEHAQRIIGADGTVEVVDIQREFEKDGEVKYINLDGDFDVVLSTGPSNASQRAETFEKLLELSRVNPIIMQTGMDIIVRTMDFAESQELADRLMAMLPPQIQQLSKKNPQQMVMQENMQMKSELEKMSMMMEEMQKALQEKDMEMKKIEADIMAKQADIESKERIAMIEAQVSLEKQDSINESKIQTELIKSASKEKESLIKAIPKQEEQTILFQI